MTARSQKKIAKAHALRKRVKLEKQRIRKMYAKKKVTPKRVLKPASRVHIKLEPEAKEALMNYCFEHNVKPYKAVRQILSMMINKDWQKLKEKLTKKELEELTSGI